MITKKAYLMIGLVAGMLIVGYACSPSAPEKPATQTETQPAAEQPAAEQPAAEQPAAEKPAAEQPAAEQPAAEQPAAEQPAAEQPAAPGKVEGATQSAMGEIQVKDLLAMVSNRDGKAFF
ncbi:MAG: hypothetical protein ACE15F_07545 [bacterium]